MKLINTTGMDKVRAGKRFEVELTSLKKKYKIQDHDEPRKTIFYIKDQQIETEDGLNWLHDDCWIAVGMKIDGII